jgi:hypothetical protein
MHSGPFEAQAAQGANTPFAALSVTLPNPGVAVTGVKISSLPTNAIRCILLYQMCYMMLNIFLYYLLCLVCYVLCHRALALARNVLLVSQQAVALSFVIMS